MNIPKSAIEAAAKHIAGEFARQSAYSLDQQIEHIETRWPRYVDEARGIIAAALPHIIDAGSAWHAEHTKEAVELGYDGVGHALSVLPPASALVEKWRKQAAEHRNAAEQLPQGDPEWDEILSGATELDCCANELEAALKGGKE